MNKYIEEDMPIEPNPIEDAYTVGDYKNDELQIIEVKYVNGFSKQILYNARPSCRHKIQAQWSGVKCIACNGWYCA